MVSSQTLKLLDALLSGSSGSETEKLKTLYKEAYCGTESFKDLTLLLERSEFHGSVGRDLMTQSKNVVEAGFTNAGSFGDSITVMEYLVEKIRQELAASAAYINSANVSGIAMNVVDKRLADNSTEFFDRLFHYVCCVYASLHGDAILKNLNVKTGIRSTDLIRNVNDELSILLAEARRMKKPLVWKIVRKHFGGINMVPYSGFMLEYGTVSTAYLQEQCDRITPTLYIPKNSSDVLCCGMGLLTNLDTASGGTVFGASVTSAPALNALDKLDLDYNNLSICVLLSKLAGSGVCILQPEAVVELLNRYFMIKTAKKNKEKGCIFCGKQGCRHFAIDRNFSR